MRKLFVLVIVGIITTSFSHKPLTWVAIGDSITYLNDHPNEAGNRITKGYMQMVAEKLPYITYINKGYNGWTSGGIAEQADKLGITKADVYSIFLGTNDWWQGRPVGTMKDYQDNTGHKTVYGAFRIIINKLRSLNSDAKIILITPMQRTDFVYIGDFKNNAYGSYKPKNGQMLSQVADAIKNIASLEKFDLVDLYYKSHMTVDKLVKFKHVKDSATGEYKNLKYPGYTSIPFNPATDEYPYPVEAMGYTYDGLHPSENGYTVITKMLVKVMKHY